MATELQHRRESMGEIPISGGSNTVFAQKAKNLAGFNEVVQEVTDPIAEGLLSAEAEADRLAKFNLEKDLPVEQIPPEEGGFNPLSLTKWGRAYDKSYNEIDKQLIGYKAEEALTQNALELARPENLGPGATARYGRDSQAIIKAYVDSAAPANRNDLMMSLTAKAREREFGIAEKEAAVARANISSQITEVISKNHAEMLDAGRMNDRLTVAAKAHQLESAINSSQNLNLITPAKAQALKENLVSEAKVALGVGEYLELKARGQGDEFLKNVFENPQKYDYTMGEAEELIGSITKVEQVEKQATSNYYSMQKLTAEADMASGALSSKLQLGNYDLSPRDTLDLEARIDHASNQNALKAAKISQAQTQIETGQSGGVSKTTIEAMAANSFSTMETPEQALPMAAKVAAMAGDPGFTPVSGIVGMSINTNVPSVDRAVSGALTSKNPASMIAGYQAYQVAVTKGQPNLLSLSADAQRVAARMTSLIEGQTDPITAANITSKEFLNQDDAGIARRLADFRSTNNQKKLPKEFQSMFGVNSNNNDHVFGVFSNQVESNYVNGSTWDEAIQITKDNMRTFAESKYFLPNTVGNLAPEQTFSMPDTVISNQLAGTVQNGINNGWQGKGGHLVEWANPQDAIDLKTLNREEYVDKALPAVKAGTLQTFLSDKRITSPTRLPEIKVNGHTSKVYLIAGDRVRFGDNGAPLYQLGYIDEVGTLQPITDGRGPNAAATFTPKDISVYAPNYFNADMAAQRKEQIKSLARAPAFKAAKELVFNKGTISNFAKALNNIDENEAKIENEFNLRETQ